MPKWPWSRVLEAELEVLMSSVLQEFAYRFLLAQGHKKGLGEENSYRYSLCKHLSFATGVGARCCAFILKAFSCDAEWHAFCETPCWIKYSKKKRIIKKPKCSVIHVVLYF